MTEQVTQRAYGTLLSGHGLASARFPLRVRLAKLPFSADTDSLSFGLDDGRAPM
jgi:hypothetical protein